MSKRDGIFSTAHMVSCKLYLLSFVLNDPTIVQEYVIWKMVLSPLILVLSLSWVYDRHWISVFLCCSFWPFPYWPESFICGHHDKQNFSEAVSFIQFLIWLDFLQLRYSLFCCAFTTQNFETVFDFFFPPHSLAIKRTLLLVPAEHDGERSLLRETVIW